MIAAGAVFLCAITKERKNMRNRKGTIVAVEQAGGCVEVTVVGECPGSFIIDNCCYRMIVNCEGHRWIGRPVEYKDAHMHFLDSPATAVGPGALNLEFKRVPFISRNPSN